MNRRFAGWRSPWRWLATLACDARQALGRAVTETEIELLGATRPDARATIAESGWLPDPPDAYCRRCGSDRQVVTGDADCPACRRRGGMPQPGDVVIRLGGYRTPLREWLLAVKYTRWEEMAAVLGNQLGLAVAAELGRWPSTSAGVVVVPMPMPALRRWHRGIDHARLLARSVASVLGGELRQPLRTATDATQAGRRSSDRRRLGGRRLGIRRHLGEHWREFVGVLRPSIGRRRWTGWGLEGRIVVLVDDVRTTGRTLEVASRLLRELQPGLIVIAVLAAAPRVARAAATGRSGRTAGQQSGNNPPDAVEVANPAGVTFVPSPRSASSLTSAAASSKGRRRTAGRPSRGDRTNKGS